MKRITTILAVAAIFIASAHGQGFLNLNFESAYDLPGNPGNGALVSVTNALPGWTAYDGTPYGGGSALSDVYYVSNTLGYQSNPELEGGTLALSGNSLSVGLYLNSAISQTGLVPGDAESLQFEALGPGVGGSLGVSGLLVILGGQTLSISALSEGSNYFVYGANIPADMAGQPEELTFLCNGSGGVLLDNIEFSPMSVPEPSQCALIGLGAVLFGIRRRRRNPCETGMP